MRLEVLESDEDELDSQQIGTWQSAPSSIDTNWPHRKVSFCLGSAS